jgi:hypothetical protein
MWLLDEADKLEDARNDSIHSPLASFAADNIWAQHQGIVGRIVPSVAFGNRRAIKLARKDLLTEFRWCRDASLTLRDFAGEIYEAVAARTAWPDRPSLPNRGRKKDAKISHPRFVQNSCSPGGCHIGCDLDLCRRYWLSCGHAKKPSRIRHFCKYKAITH